MVDVFEIIEPVYILAVLLFIYALRQMSNPATARAGILWAGAGMLLAILVTGLDPAISGNSGHLVVNLALMGFGIAIGGGIAFVAAKRVQMTDMPQMVAVYNGMGGGAAGAIAAVSLMMNGGWSTNNLSPLDIAAGLIGSISFAGSVIAFLKLQGWMRAKPITFPGQVPANLAVLGAAIVAGGLFVWNPSFLGSVPISLLAVFFALGLLYGLAMTLPIGGADMPVVISLYNALTGIAVGIDGFALNNYAMIVAGVIVGAAGSLLTILMARAMNRSISNVLFSAFGAHEEEGAVIHGSLKPIDLDDAAAMLAYAGTVIICPGYGMAVAQAQHKVKELTDVLEAKGVQVKFAIHPVAGRMPGHMNVLLAEANVPYDHLLDLDEINPEFASTDVAVVIGANDTVNPAARRVGSPLQGMPILNVDQARNVIVLKRGAGKGFAGVENDLFYKDNSRMLYGDAQETLTRLVQAVKKL
ncbi:MAG: NAD(P)(+) transhydrogenase (Re/Si-specific) subunit beta [Thermoplasmata archaeon]|nr:NAD(P)(+) transhydrogenase (Re/Si-specific) subunit beta [Thermoplasmata archaeon]